MPADTLVNIDHPAGAFSHFDDKLRAIPHTLTPPPKSRNVETGWRRAQIFFARAQLQPKRFTLQTSKRTDFLSGA
jgi:hypothetical protein